MESLQGILEKFTISWYQVAASGAVVLITYFISQLLLRISLFLYNQQVLWLRKLRYWIPAIRIVIWMSGIYFALVILHPPVELLFAIATSAGVAVGLAAQELVKNVFGAIILWSDKVYQEGDRVTVNGVEGIVQSIGIRSTKIWAYDDTIVVVPNSKLLDATVYNANSGESAEQILVDLYLPIDVDIRQAVELARRAAHGADLLEPTKPVAVVVSDYVERDTPLTRIRVKVYVRNVAYEKRLASDITTRAKRLFKEQGLYTGYGPVGSVTADDGSSAPKDADPTPKA